MSGSATAPLAWKRAGAVATLTNGLLCQKGGIGVSAAGIGGSREQRICRQIEGGI
jgi:hypothetical protein